MTVFVANESGLPLETEGFTDLLRFALAELGVHPQAEVSLLAVDLQSMSDLHEQWMDEPGPTDVMSFPMDELTERGSWQQDPAAPGPALLGDIVVCPQFAVRQAAERGHPFLHEMRILVVHGLLHLLGYDHAEPDEEAEMFAKQERVVALFEARP
jgi:probable rRNA maturation factor